MRNSNRKLPKGRFSVGRKLVSIAASAALVSSMFGVSTAAFALGADDPLIPTTGASAETAVKVAAWRASSPAPEILGMSLVQYDSTVKPPDVSSWSSLIWVLMGTNYNSNPDPYLVNTIVSNNGVAASPTVLYGGRNGGPNANLIAYDTDNAAADAVWKTYPDIVLGTGNNESSPNFYQDDETQAAGIAALQELNPDYKGPIGVTYNMSNVYTMIDVMYNLAAAGDQVVANDTNKALRYGNATEIAKKYEQYVLGTQGLILKGLAKDNTAKKTVAVVKDYDSTSNTYQLQQLGVQEGTASQSRMLEAVQNVAVNYGEEHQTATLEELQACDLVIMGGQTDRGAVQKTSIADMVAAFPDTLKNKAYWVTDGFTGAIYGTVQNSVENAQNTGRILGCLYPEYVDQSDLVAYYYETFYHIANGRLGTIIDGAMDGVRNITNQGENALQWSASDVSDYKRADVESDLQDGAVYLVENKDSINNGLLVPSETLTASLPISGDDPTDPEAAIGSIAVKGTYNVKAGDIIKVPVVVTGAQTIACMQVDVKFDNTTLEYVGFESDLEEKGASVKGNTVTFTGFGNETSTAAGLTVATLSFKVVNSGNSMITISKAIAGLSGELTDETLEVAGYAVVNSNVVKGDVNNNGAINIVDAQIIYDLSVGVYGADYSKLPISCSLAAAYVNNDDVIDASDARAVQVYIHTGHF